MTRHRCDSFPCIISVLTLPDNHPQIIPFNDRGGTAVDPNMKTLMSSLEQARLHLNSVIDQITPQVEIYPSWQLKQLLDHITGWDELVCQILLAHAKGESLPLTAKNIDRFNERSISSRQAVSLAKSRQDYDDVRSELLRILQSLPEELFAQKFTAPWGGQWTIARTLKLFVQHEQEHAQEVEKILLSTSLAG
jgi:hypothetical protein